MVKCTFCKNELEKGIGKMFVKKDGTILYFCSMKCEKNAHKLHRNPRKVKWTETARADKTKEVKK
tara:strand:+ start:1448 stop:1642 length:195 start_codon:yes stop_codon:yes gene_type:complete